jgi:uncharacterized protein
MTRRNIVHTEIPTADNKASAEFYEKLFGWHMTHDEKNNYTMWDPHDGPGGGFSPMSYGAKVGEVIIYVNSEDIEADLKQAVALGGSLVREKEEIPDTGWFAMFKDPTGNTIGLYTSLNPASNP